MKELKNELRRKEYVDITTLDLEYPPENVLIYLNNRTDSNIRVSVQFLDKDIQTQFDNQNPTLIVEDTGETTICLSVEDNTVKPLTCDGAVNTVDIHEFVRISETGLIPNTSSVFKVNGQVTPEVPSYITLTDLPRPSFNPPEGYKWDYSYRFTNKSLEDVKIEALYLPVNQNQYSTVVMNNPTSVEDPENNRIGFCLSAGEEVIPEIDCAQAIPFAKYAIMTSTNEVINPILKLIIDGVEMNENSEPPSWFISEETSEPYPYPIPEGYALRTVMKFISKDTVPHTIEILSENDDSLPVIYDNPTVVEFSKYRVGVCLLGEEQLEINCDNSIDTTGCFNLEGTWDLEVNGNIVLTNATDMDIQSYLMPGGNMSLEAGNTCCDMGYFRSIHLTVDGLVNGSVVYIPIALTPGGPSITSPITISVKPEHADDWYMLGYDLSEKLNQQLEPHGLNSDWTNNFKEFGVTYYNVKPRREDVMEFYVLEEGNTFPPFVIPRGLPPITCYYPS